MARVLGVSTVAETKKSESDTKELDIKKLVDDYFTFNSEKKKYTDLTKVNGEKIKNYLTKNKLTEFDSGKHKASISSSDSIEYDDEKLLKLVKALPEDISSQIIQTVEVVNLEKLERLLVEGKITTKQFSDAEVTKTTVKLYVK